MKQSSQPLLQHHHFREGEKDKSLWKQTAQITKLLNRSKWFTEYKMVKRTGPTTLALQQLIHELEELSKEQKSALWKRVAADLSRATRKRREVNLYQLQKTLRDGETALVPGKVLSVGGFHKKNTIAAYVFSGAAREKINKTGKAISIHELLAKNPAGKNVRIMG